MEATKFLFWLLFVVISAIAEAVIFHHFYTGSKPHKEKPRIDEHVWLSLLLAAVFIGIFIDFKPIPNLIICMLTFSFIHDGIYYEVRNFMNPHIFQKGFLDQSTTTDATISLGPAARIWLFCMGILAFIVEYWQVKEIL